MHTRNTLHYWRLLNDNPAASVSATLVAAMVYSARHGACEHADQSTEEYKQIVRSLLSSYGDSLSPIDARKEFARALPRPKQEPDLDLERSRE
ncbi:MAG: hypothetical protein KGZ53_02775 [Peptococcaceae bacterium]|nr:hypothetical protein [Peptococcaceae bacterium]